MPTQTEQPQTQDDPLAGVAPRVFGQAAMRSPELWASLTDYVQMLTYVNQSATSLFEGASNADEHGNVTVKATKMAKLSMDILLARVAQEDVVRVTDDLVVGLTTFTDENRS